MVGFFDDPGMAMFGTQAQPGFMANPGIGPFATNLGMALLAAGQGGGAPHNRFADAAPYISQAVSAPMQLRQQQMMQQLYGAQLKKLGTENSVAEATAPLQIQEAKDAAARRGFINSMLGMPSTPTAPQPSLMDGPTVENATAMNASPGLMGPTQAAASALPVTGAQAAPAQPSAGSPFANLTPLQRLAIASDPKGATEKLMAMGQWVQKDVNGIPMQQNTITGELKPIDPTLSKVTVNPSMNMPPTESSFQKTLGDELGKQAGGIYPDADKARNMLANTQQLRSLTEMWKQQGGTQGFTAPLQASLTSIAQGIGLDTSGGLAKSLGLAQDAGPSQAIDALMRKMAMGNIGGEGGMPANNFSEADRNFIVDQQPTLKDTPQAYEAKLSMIEKMAQRTVQKEQMWSQYEGTAGGYTKFRKDWSDYVSKNPLFSEDDKKSIRALGRGNGGGTPGATIIRFDANGNRI